MKVWALFVPVPVRAEGLFARTRRMRAAEAGIEELQKHVDTLIVIPNQNLFLVAKAETTFKEAFQLADEVLQQGVRSITDLMVMPGLINLDFADVRSVMSEMGKAMMGTGEGEGENRALDAAEQAIANPLLDGVSMAGARGVIISIIGGEDMRLLEVDEAANHIRELVDEDANIIWGSAFNPDLNGKIRVSVVATGIDSNGEMAAQAAPATRLLWDGDMVDLGDRQFEVIHTPGHSPGGIALWEAATGVLFSGDIVYDGPLIEDTYHSNAADYHAEKGSVMSWMISITRYRALDLLKSRRVKAEHLDISEPEHDQTSNEVQPGEVIGLVREKVKLDDCMQGLSDEHRQSIQLAYFNGLSHQEITEHTGSALGTVKSWIRRGLTQLKRCLEA